MHNKTRPTIPVIGVVAKSGTGKTTLLTKVIPLLRQHHISVAVIKHSHHDIEIDKPGKDSYKLRESGAVQTLIASPHRIAMINERDAAREEPTLGECLPYVDPQQVDLILIEGFKGETYPKIELHRQSVGSDYLYPCDSDIVALATDAPPGQECPIPILDINDPSSVADFIVNHVI